MSSDDPKARRRLVSAGVVAWRRREGALEVCIVHPGGPFFAHKDEGAWSIPKGVVDHELVDEETLLETALRELGEETGLMPEAELVPLGAIKQRGGKTVHAFAVYCDEDPPRGHRPPQIRIEYPPGSMRELAFPEVDQVAFVSLELARVKLNPAQVELLDRLEALAVAPS